MKKYLSILLAVLMAAGLFAVSASAKTVHVCYRAVYI